MDNADLLARIDRRLDLTADHIRQSEGHMRQIEGHMRQSEGHMRQIEAHIRQTNEYIQQGNGYMRQGAEEMRKLRIAVEENTRAIADLRTTLNQWNVRQEKMMREVLAASSEMIASFREFRRDSIEEARAQRAALFLILDEMRGGGAATA